MELLVYFLSGLIGIVLGLLGGGGSILTLPLLVYLGGINPVLATAYSLFTVGMASGFGAVIKFKQKEISVRTAIIFSIPSLIAVFISRYYILPNISDIIYFGKYSLSKDGLIMYLFALIMFISSVSMIRGNKKSKKYKQNLASSTKNNYSLILLEGLVVGLLTGLIGAGGGFLIIPALVIITKIPMKKAVGTSLLIIFIKSIVGFTGDLVAGQNIDWGFLLIFSCMTLIGTIIGTYSSKLVTGKFLRSTFGWFVFGMSLFIIFLESYQ